MFREGREFCRVRNSDVCSWLCVREKDRIQRLFLNFAKAQTQVYSLSGAGYPNLSHREEELMRNTGIRTGNL